MDRIIQRAGLTPRPKAFQNLRASRASDLVKEHGVFLAARRLGHDTLVTQKHYWQVTDDDIDKAAGAAKALR
jgi:hypothetical protein